MSLTEEQIREKFDEFDKDGSGVISASEVLQYVMNMPDIPEEEAAAHAGVRKSLL